MTDRELFDLMWQASWRATQAAIEAGNRRDSQVVKDSAWTAAQAVYQRERPGEAPLTRHPLPAQPDIVQERMEREPVVPTPMFDADPAADDFPF